MMLPTSMRPLDASGTCIRLGAHRSEGCTTAHGIDETMCSAIRGAVADPRV